MTTELAPETYRRGDLLFRRIPTNSFPLENMTERKNGHILEGEVTGHIHRVEQPWKESSDWMSGKVGTARVFETLGGLLFLQALMETNIVHEDRDTITLPAGDYEIVRQREYAPDAVRQVMD